MFKRTLHTFLLLAAGMIGAELALAGGMGGGGPTTPITLTNIIDADFGTIDVTVGAGNIDLGTNGAIVYGAGYAGAGTGTAGQFRINGSKNFNADISCSASATLANASGNTMPISVVELRIENTGAFGSGTTCNGLGNTILTHRIRNQANRDTVFVGMRINGTGGVPAGAGAFSTSNAGGTAVTIDVVYQ